MGIAIVGGADERAGSSIVTGAGSVWGTDEGCSLLSISWLWIIDGAGEASALISFGGTRKSMGTAAVAKLWMMAGVADVTVFDSADFSL